MAKKQNKRLAVKAISPNQRSYTIPDHRLEKPSFSVRQVRKGGKITYEVTGDLSAPVPPIRESKYLSKKQCIFKKAICDSFPHFLQIFPDAVKT